VILGVFVIIAQIRALTKSSFKASRAEGVRNWTEMPEFDSNAHFRAITSHNMHMQKLKKTNVRHPIYRNETSMDMGHGCTRLLLVKA